jgi:hypothetical protein
MSEADIKSVDRASDVREFPKGAVEVVTIFDTMLSRATLEPGWRWSECVKPIAGTDLCMVAHTGYSVSGKLRTRLQDGTELDINPGDAYAVAPGHDAWVVGDEPWVGVDFSPAMSEYGKS